MGIMDLFKKKTSGNVAKDRLKLVLVSDRANCSSEMMEMMKNDIIEVISRYMDIDAEALEIRQGVDTHVGTWHTSFTSYHWSHRYIVLKVKQSRGIIHRQDALR